MTATPPFIHDQAVFRLTAPAEQRGYWLGLKFSQRRWLKDAESDQLASQSLPTEQETYCWEEHPDRWQLFADPTIRLMVVADDAGMGKSMATEQIVYARQQADSGHLAIWCRFDELPHDWNNYRNDVGNRTAFLRSLLREKLGDEINDAQLDELLRQKLDEGRLTLVVDSLDQSNLHEHPEHAARHLAKFLKAYPKIRCVAAGRPFAIGHYWETLFSQCGRRAEDQWELVQLAEFTEGQAHHFVGEARAKRLQDVQAEVLATPRDLETILTLTPAELDGVQTSADIYWRCFEKALTRGVTNQLVRINAPTALKLFSLLAFETVKRGQYAGVDADGGRSGLDQSAFDELVDELVETRPVLTTVLKRSGGTVDSLLGQLGALNLALDPGIVSVASDTDPNTPVLRELYWRNRTLQDFLAAVWLLRFSTLEDRSWLMQRKFVRGDGDKSQEHKELYQLWKFVCEMPADAQPKDRERFVDVARSLLLPSDHPEFTVRSTEMIWRCWPRMLDAAGLVKKKERCETDFVPLTQQLQQEAKELAECATGSASAGTESERKAEYTGGASGTPANAAKTALLQYLGEYHRIRHGRHDGHSDDAAEVANWFEGGFRLVPPHAEDSLQTWFGNAGLFSFSDEEDNPVVISIAARFQLNQFPTTNGIYDLFDSRHAGRFSDYRTRSASPRSPAVHVSWFDAWASSVWLGGQLPDEFEWEFACRANPGGDAERTEYCFGNNREQLADYAWFGSNSQNRTHEVQFPSGEPTKAGNSWELYHMHGNVWEWCVNMWAENALASRDPGYRRLFRVLRGGSFGNDPGLCRSADRNRNDPDDAGLSRGFRVSRVAT